MAMTDKAARIARAVVRRTRSKLTEDCAIAKARCAIIRRAPVDLRYVFSHVDDQTWLELNTSGYRRSRTLQHLLPSMPDPGLQKDFIGSSGDAALGEAWVTYCLWRELAGRYGHPIEADSYVLDFGCGWGRTLRFFLKDVLADHLYGVDVLELAVNTCRETNKLCHFELVQPTPPSQLPSDRFDLVYLYSVFSHLSESVHNQWLDEFHRILRPGGILIATTWHRNYIQWCEDARHGPRKWTHPNSRLAFIGNSEWLARYDRGEFCHSPIGGGDGDLDATFYGETCIHEAYVRNNWTDRFEICEYFHADFIRLWQDAIVARKK